MQTNLVGGCDSNIFRMESYSCFHWSLLLPGLAHAIYSHLFVKANGNGVVIQPSGRIEKYCPLRYNMSLDVNMVFLLLLGISQQDHFV
jgi:hypothetical protein